MAPNFPAAQGHRPLRSSALEAAILTPLALPVT